MKSSQTETTDGHGERTQQFPTWKDVWYLAQALVAVAIVQLAALVVDAWSEFREKMGPAVPRDERAEMRLWYEYVLCRLGRCE